MSEDLRRQVLSSVLFALGIVALILASHMAYSELFSVVGASALTLAGGTARPLFDRYRARRQAEKARRMLEASIEQQRLRIGDVEVPQLSAQYMCDRDHGLERKIAMDFPCELGNPRPPSGVLGLLKERLLPQLEEEAIQQGAGFFDEPAVDLLAVVHSGQTDDGKTILQFRFAETSYFIFALTSNVLDKKLGSLVPELGAPTLREHWKHQGLRHIQDVGQLPAPAVVGVACAVVTRDGLLVLLERGQVFQAPSRGSRVLSGGGKVELHGVAEGMIPADFLDGRISPVQTVYRGLWEELSVGREDVDRLQLTGLFLDHERWQPLFTALSFIGLDACQLRERMSHAAHRHETRELIGFQFDPADPDLKSVLLGAHAEFGLVSNHAQAVVLAALTAERGVPAVASYLRGARR